VTRSFLLAGLLAAGLALAGCGGTTEREQAPISERESRDRSARLAFDQGRYAQAATLYAAVLQAALAEDAPTAIVDARFNLALCQMHVGDHEAALTQTDQAEAERQRRGLPVDPALQLLVGTIHYRAGDRERAQATLSAVLQERAANAAIRAKAHFVAGLIAADRATLPALREHIAALQANAGVGPGADYLELQGRLLGLDDDIDGALGLLDQAADLRGFERDYRGMARALATAGGFAEQAGRLQPAANYLFRAGRSAAQRAEPDAQDWLRRAMDLGRRSGDIALVKGADAILRNMAAEE
jgi:tetratricopeptide (TPR) repeat protein